MTDEFLPYSKPDIGEDEISAVTDTLRSGWVTTGPAAAAFETEFAEFAGGEVHAIAVNSATAGLHLALEACGIGAGDEVIVPTWTFTATAEVVRYMGATPVVVDVDRATLNIDLDAVRAAVTSRTAAVIVVHFGGLSVDMVALREVVGADIRVIEDAAHAIPASKGGVLVGSAVHSDAAVFSFYANKTMTTGEGGMITTRDEAIAKRARVMRLHGIDRDVFGRYQSTRPAWAYDVVAPGFKYNLPDPAAAMGRVQLRRVREMQGRRRAIARHYLKELAGLPLTLPADSPRGDEHAWHLFVIRLRPDARLERDDVVSKLSDLGIGTSVHFIPLHRHTYWRESLELQRSSYPVADAEFERAISLPIFSRMTDNDRDRVVDALWKVLTG